LWKNDRGFLTRLMVRARVTNLVDVPHFIVLTDTQGFQSQSWTVQCEIMQQHLLEVLPQDEDPVPPQLDNGQPPMFDFIGLGQPGIGPFNHQEPEDEEQQLIGYGEWAQQDPDAAAAAMNDEDQNVQMDNNNQEPMPDLNLVPFAKMEEPDDAIDQLIVFPDLNFALGHGQVQNFAIGNAPPQAPLSMEMRPFPQDDSLSTQSIEQQFEEPEVVLALQVAHVSFLPLEIESNELNAGESSEEGFDGVAGNIIPYTGIPLNSVSTVEGTLNGAVGEGSSSSNHLRETNGMALNVIEEGSSSNSRIHLGMVLLPDNLYVDPRMIHLESS
jgi:hypothetical protein